MKPQISQITQILIKNDETMMNNEDRMVLLDKVEDGKRLSFEEGAALYDFQDIWELGRLVEKVTFDRVGKNVYYSVNRHINYSNICRINEEF